MVNPFKQANHSFIMTFGISVPRSEQDLTASVLICTILLGTILFVVTTGVFHLSRLFQRALAYERLPWDTNWIRKDEL
jgi:hypothetical protein